MIEREREREIGTTEEGEWMNERGQRKGRRKSRRREMCLEKVMIESNKMKNCGVIKRSRNRNRNRNRKKEEV